MTMPLSDEQLSREIVSLEKSITDFRNEMRAAMTGVVRLDVYQAQQETLRAQINAQMETMKGEVAELRGKVKTLEDEKRQRSGIVYGAVISAALALVMSFINLKS